MSCVEDIFIMVDSSILSVIYGFSYKCLLSFFRNDSHVTSNPAILEAVIMLINSFNDLSKSIENKLSSNFFQLCRIELELVRDESLRIRSKSLLSFWLN